MEDYRFITLHDNKLKVFRNGIIQREFVYKYGSRDGIYKKGDIIWKLVKQTKNTVGYYVCRINKKNYLIHRIIAYTFLGLDIDNLTQVIDHIDRIKINNNLINLRIVTKQQNYWNKEAKGYWFNKRRNRYEAEIRVSGKKISLGRYKTEAAARYAYVVGKAHYHQF